MNCNGCDGCGKGYPEITQIHPCQCFLAAFCTVDCFEQSSHKLECDLINGPISRLRGKSDIGQKLSKYTMMLYEFAEAETSGKESKRKEARNILNEITLRDANRNADLQTLLDGWNTKNTLAISYMQAGNRKAAESELNQIKGASNTVIAIFKSENRLSLKQRGKDIENAWNSYLQALRDAIMTVPKSGEPLLDAYSKFNDASLLAVSVGNTLGGGKDMTK